MLPHVPYLHKLHLTIEILEVIQVFTSRLVALLVHPLLGPPMWKSIIQFGNELCGCTCTNTTANTLTMNLKFEAFYMQFKICMKTMHWKTPITMNLCIPVSLGQPNLTTSLDLPQHDDLMCPYHSRPINLTINNVCKVMPITVEIKDPFCVNGIVRKSQQILEEPKFIITICAIIVIM